MNVYKIDCWDGPVYITAPSFLEALRITQEYEIVETDLDGIVELGPLLNS